MCIIQFGSFCFAVQIDTRKYFCCLQNVPLWSPGVSCLQLIRFFCGRRTLMLAVVQLETCVFALHHPVPCSCAQPPSQQPSLQPRSQCSGFWAAAESSGAVCCVFRHTLCYRCTLFCSTYTSVEPSTSQSDGKRKPVKRSRLETLKKAKNPRVLKTVLVTGRVETLSSYCCAGFCC